MTAGVRSFGLPIRFICEGASATTSATQQAQLTGGTLCMISTRCGCSCLKFLVMSDSVYPGEIELTLMFCGASSTARALVNISTAPFEAW